MIPNSSVIRIGRTTVNSAIVWPCSLLMFGVLLISRSWWYRGALAARRGPHRWPSCLRQQPHHVADCVFHSTRKAGEQREGGQADHREGDCVLRHRLAA